MRRLLQLILVLLILTPINLSYATDKPATTKENLSKGDSSYKPRPIDTNFEKVAKESAKVGQFILLKNEKFAIAYIESKKIAFRIASRDGKNFPLTMDYRPNRINLNIIKGKVKGFNVG